MIFIHIQSKWNPMIYVHLQGNMWAFYDTHLLMHHTIVYMVVSSTEFPELHLDVLICKLETLKA